MDFTEQIADYVPAPGSVDYYSTLFVAPTHKDLLHALLGLKAELRGIPRTTSDPGVARIKLQWWQDEIQRLCKQQESRHPLTRIMQANIPFLPVGERDLVNLVESVERELSYSPIHSYADLRQRVSQGSGVFLAATAFIGSSEVPNEQLRLLTQLSTTLELILSLQTMRPDYERGQMNLPLNELPQEPLSIAEGLSPTWQKLLVDHTQRLRDELINDIKAASAISKRGAVHLFVRAAIQRAMLEEVLRDGCRLFSHRLELTPLRMFWIAWRAQRRLPK